MTQTLAAPGTSLEPYTTSDTPFAAYLHFNGHRVISSKQDPNDYKREVLIFVYREEIPELEDTWRLGKAVGDLRKYQRSLKIINNYIKEQRKHREG